MKVGIILVHGFSGNYTDLNSLYEFLCLKFGRDSVLNLKLYNHETDCNAFKFEYESYTDGIYSAYKKFSDEGRKIIFTGHSTGGVFILSTVKKYNLSPLLIILAATPYKVDINYIERWKNKSVDVSFADTAEMVSLINKTCRKFESEIPLAVINGENDLLVTKENIDLWRKHKLNGILRTFLIPGGTHQLFLDENKLFAIDLIHRNIVDALNYASAEDSFLLSALFKNEKKAEKFVEQNSFSETHLLNSPSFKRLTKQEIKLTPFCKNDPIMANICISTYCNLKCKYCYRTQNPVKPQNMLLESFIKILDYLPNTYKITLVGNGEPLMNPEIADFVNAAAERNRKTVLVTNGMLLNEKLSEKLIESGLDSITFSIDYFDSESAERLRSGTVFDTVRNNIKSFMKRKEDRMITAAAFAAVSLENIEYLDGLIDFLLELDIHVLMLTDLNFINNQDKALSKNINQEQIKILRKTIKYGFSKKMIILTVRALENFGIQTNYLDYLLIPPDQLYKRSEKRTFCLSPWQTVPIDVNGNISFCDCQHNNIIGNIFSEPFSEVWNGENMLKLRKTLLSEDVSAFCRICPRF